MQFHLSLNIEQINAILRHLDAGPHGSVRQLIDIIIASVNEQQSHQQSTEQTPTTKPKNDKTLRAEDGR